MLAVQLPTSQLPKKLADISYGLATKRGGALRRIRRRGPRQRYEMKVDPTVTQYIDA